MTIHEVNMTVNVDVTTGEDLVSESTQQVQEAAEAVRTECGPCAGRGSDGVNSY